MSVDGWVKIHRCLQDNPLWSCEKFTRGQAWIDLILLANHKDSFFYKRGVKIDVTRGQCGRSEVELADRWKWSRTKVRKFLKDLEKEQQIKQQKTNVSLVVTILNYNKYQEKEQQKDTKKTPEKHIQERKEGKEKYGTFNNVMLTRKEFDSLKKRFNGKVEEKINNLSEYVESKGKRYRSHYATILNWSRRDDKQSKDDGWT